jgi:hypothetical protein
MTTAGRPACNTQAADRVATLWSLARSSGEPAHDTTATGVSGGQPAARSLPARATSWRPAM